MRPFNLFISIRHLIQAEHNPGSSYKRVKQKQATGPDSRASAILQKSFLSEGYQDDFDDYFAFLEPRLLEAHRILESNGSIYFHIDYREVHYCKILLDKIFGRECLLERDHLGIRLRRQNPKTLAG